METKLKINIESSHESYETEVITGLLDSIIIDSGDEKCEVIIESEYGYFVLHRRDHKGVQYYAPRARTTTPVEHFEDYPTFDKFNLNERLYITIIGKKGKLINMILRVQ